MENPAVAEGDDVVDAAVAVDAEDAEDVVDVVDALVVLVFVFVAGSVDTEGICALRET